MRQTLGCRDIHPLELPVGTDNIPPPPDAVGALAAGGVLTWAAAGGKTLLPGSCRW